MWWAAVGGTTPAHIKAIAECGAREQAPRDPGARAHAAPERAGGLHGAAGDSLHQHWRAHECDGVAEVCEADPGGNYDEALAVARQQVAAGAQVIDINMDEGMLDAWPR